MLRNKAIRKRVTRKIRQKENEKSNRINQNDRDCWNKKFQYKVINEIVYFKCMNSFFEDTRQCIVIMQSLLKNWFLFNLHQIFRILTISSKNSWFRLKNDSNNASFIIKNLKSFKESKILISKHDSSSLSFYMRIHETSKIERYSTFYIKTKINWKTWLK